ncbi:MAG: hypothetical protein EOO99_07285 [Pedobacter sp.]|nr:MAG: hypothetical protein EOO99_07285 [Pedobacter sp.]
MKIKKLQFFLSFILGCFGNSLWAQEAVNFNPNTYSINHYFNHISRPADSLTGRLDLGIHSFNYFRNYEYSNKFHDGYTLYGSQLEANLNYYAHANLLLTIGVNAQKDFGQRGFHEILPIIKLTYTRKDLSLIFGQIEGNVAQGYIEPLQNLESKINQPVQYGTQLKIQKPSYSLDAWISWQKMIYPRDSLKEEILGGILFEPLIIKQGRHQLSIPLQIIAYHKGGQIDVIKDVPLSTLSNSTIGFKYHYLMPGRIKRLYTENYGVFFKDFSPQKQLAYKAGTGIYLNAGLQATWGNLQASYWHANSYLSIQGMPLFQSYSNTVHNAGYTEKNRELLLLQYSYQKQLLPNFYLDLRFEPFFDFNNKAKNLQFNHSVFISYKTNFKLHQK